MNSGSTSAEVSNDEWREQGKTDVIVIGDAKDNESTPYNDEGRGEVQTQMEDDVVVVTTLPLTSTGVQAQREELQPINNNSNNIQEIDASITIDDMNNNKDEKNGDDLVSKYTALVHPKLQELPERTACMVACCIICCMIIFVIIMTLYTWIWDCEKNLVLLDANFQRPNELQQQLENPSISFEGYQSMFEGSETMICASYQLKRWYDQTTGEIKESYYEYPCLLADMECEDDYTDASCPDEFLYHFCDQLEDSYRNGNPRFCSEYSNRSVSVAYVHCQSFFMAFSDAMVYLTYIQIFLVVNILLCYKGCCQGCCWVCLPSRWRYGEDGSRRSGMSARELHDVVLTGLSR